MCRPSTRITYFDVMEMAAAERVGPELGRADEHADADARDVGAREVRPLAAEQPAQHAAPPAIDVAIARNVRDQLSRKPNGDLADDQDAGHEDGREVALVDARPGGRRGAPRRRRDRAGHRHAGSFDLVDAVRLGLRQLLRLARRPAHHHLLDAPRRCPRPKCSRRWFCAQKPDPPETSCTCCWPFQNTVTCAPIALRLLHAAGGSAVGPAAALEIELDPVAARCDLVAVEQQRPALIRDDHVEHAAVATGRPARPTGRRSGRSRPTIWRHVEEAARRRR